MARPKKQTTVSKTKKEKKVAAKEILAPATVYIGELPNSDNEKDSIDNLTLATKDLRKQKSPVFDIKKQFDGDPIFAKYQEMCSIESDINLLLPKIYEIALLCEHCTEFGVRRPTSTWALLAAKPKRVVSYDIGRWDDVDEVEKLCLDEGQNFQFITQNVLEADIEQTDLLLVDSYHSFNQATAELKTHAHKVNKYIIFHDTAEYAYRWKSEAWYPGVADHMNDPVGLYPAIENFIKGNPDWNIIFETEINNGLTILKRN